MSAYFSWMATFEAENLERARLLWRYVRTEQQTIKMRTRPATLPPIMRYIVTSSFSKLPEEVATDPAAGISFSDVVVASEHHFEMTLLS